MPVISTLPEVRSRSIAGARTRSSSSPNNPCSEACGLTPASARRGRSNAPPVPERPRRDGRAPHHELNVEKVWHAPQWHVNGEKGEAQGSARHGLFRSHDHGHIGDAAPIRQKFRVSGEFISGGPQGGLRDRGRHQPIDLARQGHGYSQIDGTARMLSGLPVSALPPRASRHVPGSARESDSGFQRVRLRAKNDVLGRTREAGILECRDGDFGPDSPRVSESDGDPWSVGGPGHFALGRVPAPGPIRA